MPEPDVVRHRPGPGPSPGDYTGVLGPVTGLPSGGPTFEGYLWFVSAKMGIPSEVMPSQAALQVAYDQALNLAYVGLASIPSQPTTPNLYAFAVYNLACAIMLECAFDDPNLPEPYNTYWEDLRNKLGLNSFTYGLVNSAADQGTSESMYIPDIIKNMTLLDLQLAKSPWGRMYLMIAGEWGSLWGITY